MSARKSKTDLLVKVRYQNPLPAPPFPPKLLKLPTRATRYGSYDFLTGMGDDKEWSMAIDAEGGMPLDLLAIPSYYETDGRSGEICPDPHNLPPLDDADIELLGDYIPSTSTAPTPTYTGVERKKTDVSWLRKTEYISSADSAFKPGSSAVDLQPRPQDTPAQVIPIDQRREAIQKTFIDANTPLDALRHPTKKHLTAVESFPVLPDANTWANQYSLIKFHDDPSDIKNPLGLKDERLEHVICRVVNLPDQDPKIAFYMLQPDADVANYKRRRREGPKIDDPDSLPAESDETFEFKYVRDYDAIQREIKNELAIALRAADEDSGTQKGAYYIQVGAFTTLRKRRTKKGDPAPTDYGEGDTQFWGGINLGIGGREELEEDALFDRQTYSKAVREPITS